MSAQTPQEGSGQTIVLAPPVAVPESRSAQHSAPQRIVVSLPVPPSTNHLYTTVRGRRVLSAAGRAYHHDAGWLVKEAAMKAGWRTRPAQRYRVEMVLHFANKRVRDIDNTTKATIDSAAAALGFNDSRIDELHVFRGDPDKMNPRCVFSIEVLPPPQDTAEVSTVSTDRVIE